MKLIIGVSVVIFLVALGVWRADVAEDRKNTLKITEKVLAYNDWGCGYQNQHTCSVAFDVKAGAVFDVQRIRYGKDFMAIQIYQNGLTGWVIFGKGVQVSANPNT